MEGQSCFQPERRRKISPRRQVFRPADISAKTEPLALKPESDVPVKPTRPAKSAKPAKPAGPTQREDLVEQEAQQPSKLERWLGGRVVLENESTWFVLLNALGFFCTYLLVAWPASPGLEANPVAGLALTWGFRAYIVLKLIMTVVPMVCCELIARRNRPLGRYLLLALTVVVGGIVAHGASVIASGVVR